MTYILYLCRGILMMLSLSGYCLFVGRRLKVERYFVPVTVLISISLWIYLVSMLKLMLPAIWIAYLGGLALLVYQYLRKDWIPPRVTVALVVATALITLFLVVMAGMDFVHYDNFSHWAIAVKQMYSDHRYPGLEQGLISFKGYPPATTITIYYFVYFVGQTPGMMLLASNLLLVACVGALFGIIRSKNRFLLYVMIGAGSAVLTYLNLSVRINNLLVDFLLPMLVLAAVAAIYRYQEQPLLAGLLAAPILAYTTIVSGMGLVFAALGGGYLFFAVLGRKENRSWRTAGLLLAAAVFIVIPALLWLAHMEYISAGQSSPAFAGETAEYLPAAPEQYAQICSLFVREALDLTGRAAHFFLACNLAAGAGAVYVRVKRKLRWNLAKLLALGDLMVVLYYLGLLGLYLYVMPVDEAVRLAGFDRYSSSIMVFFGGLLLLGTTIDVERSLYPTDGSRNTYRAFSSPQAKRHYQTGILVLSVLTFLFLYSEINGLRAIQQDYAVTVAGRVSEVVGDRWYQRGAWDENRYLVIAADHHGTVSSHEVRYTARYFLYAPEVEVIDYLNKDNLEEVLTGFDRVLILDPEVVNPNVGEALYEILKEPGIYEVSELQQNADGLLTED